jgi:hypothetical protein
MNLIPSRKDTFGPYGSCYLDEIPVFVGPELTRLYETLHSSLPFFELFRSTKEAHCYVSWRDGLPAHIFVFVFRDNCLDVLNEMIEVDEQEIARFTRLVFARFGHVDLIRFKALKTELRDLEFPVQQYAAKYTYCIALPETPDAYTASLGGATRGSVKHKCNRIRKTFPNARMEFRNAREVDDEWLHEIMRLSEEGIAARGLKIRHDREKISVMAKRCGFVSALLVDERIVAGMIVYQFGSSYFTELLGYDKHFQKYGMGTVCAYQTIREIVARGGKRCYLGGGHFEYKQHLGAKLLCMDELKIYRSHTRMLANLHHAAGMVLNARMRAAKEYLHRHRKHALARLVFDGFYHLKSRNVK